ncbi:MAG TPA: carboxypeptidase regulatory-like domain-containing protein [Pyrinomonadaceae bacterium]|nr:carboxypeptidase regulatory-like domain-containing protein [Pyrinomonadaceae bacterium]
MCTETASSGALKGSSRGRSIEIVAESSRMTAVPPQYRIYDIGVVQGGDTASQGFGVSTGGAAVGRSVRSGGAQAFTWTSGGGIVGLPNLSGRAFCVSNGANNNGIVAGTCASTLFGSSRLPVIWQNGAVSQLPLPSGETLGDASDVNAAGVAVGSVSSGSLQRGVVYSGGTATVITQTTSNGSFFLTAFGINDSGRVVGQGIDPTNAARNVGIVYDIGTNSAFEVGALPGANGALAFAVSNSGHVVGSSMLNQGSGAPFIWSQSGGMVAIPLAPGTTQGSARAVNSAGWVVGNDSGQFSVPFLYDGTATYRLADLIPAGTGWDLSMNTSSSALGISEHNIIVGTGVYNGQVRAYAMVPVTNASLGGRILTANGAGIRNAVVAVSGGNLPAPVTMLTGSFGYYNFQGLQPGLTYTVSVTAKRYAFAQPTRTITLQADVADFDFVADPPQ